MEIFIDKLLGKGELRRFLICKELSIRGEVTVKRLEQVCKCTKKTVESDINIINNNYAIKGDIVILKRRLGIVYVENKKSIYLNIISREFIVQSIPFKLLNEVVMDKDVTITKFKKSNFVSYSSVYSGLEKLNRFLSDYNLKIDHFKLVGNEYKVRIFLFHLYWEIFGGAKWPFGKIDRNSFSTKISELEYCFSREFTWIESEKVHFWMAIFHVRTPGNQNNYSNDAKCFWENFDISSQNIIKNSIEQLSGLIGVNLIHILVILFLICDGISLREDDFELDKFDDSLSIINSRIINRMSENFFLGHKVNKAIMLQKMLIKLIHYEGLGEAYTGLVLKENGNFQINKITEYPELVSISHGQASRIIQIFETSGFCLEQKYSIYIGSKYGDIEMLKIKYLLECYGPSHYKYFSLWESKPENSSVIITDIENYFEKSSCLKIELKYPFDKNSAILVIEELKSVLKK